MTTGEEDAIRRIREWANSFDGLAITDELKMKDDILALCSAFEVLTGYYAPIVDAVAKLDTCDTRIDWMWVKQAQEAQPRVQRWLTINLEDDQ